MAEKVAPDVIGIFPQKMDEEHDQFRLLDYANIDARYNTKFKIIKNELGSLAKCVKKLLDFIEQVCKEKIQNF